MRNVRLPLSCRLFLALVVATLFASGVAEAQSAVPFNATIAITESIELIGAPPCILVGNISGTGLATQLGKVTLVSSDCINPTDQTLTAFSFFSLPENDVVLTVVANGDQIFATYSGTLTFEGTVGVISGVYNIYGGSGRYLHAFGAGLVQGVEDRSTGQGNIQLTGTISF
jgi:hypothetical protein